MSKVVACLLALAVACGKSGSDSGSSSGSKDRPKVAVSIFPLYDLVRRVAGDRVEVLLVLPPGRSEHEYDPTPKDIARLDGAKLAIAIGLDMDTWVETIVKGAGGAPIFHVGDKIKTMPIAVEPIGEAEAHAGEAPDSDDKPGAPDPHVWLDPERMKLVVDSIAEQLTAIDPEGKTAFAAAADKLKGELQTLDAKIAARAKTWSKTTIVTFHGSMSYYAKHYGLRIAAVVEPLAGKEPTAAYIAEVLGAIKAGHAAALFSEPQFDKAPAETIAKEAGVPLGELDPVGGVTGRDSYEALLLWNTDQLDKVLK
ncbi:MAG TPA: metal ABC transporter substrate-binding protein [Kofleriaceae bacterium]|nr:metal ABC transporter substrate-binding protein [Kofleriaceae bacterium]